MSAIKSFYSLFSVFFTFTSLSAFAGNNESLRLACFYYNQEDIHNGSSFIHPGLPWIWAKNDRNQQVYIDGIKSDGFFKADFIQNPNRNTDSLNKSDATIAQELCEQGFKRAFPANYKNMILVKTGVKSSFLSLYSFPLVFTQAQQNEKAFKEIDKVVIFGDSMSDTGNLKTWIRIFPDEPYFAGRFSDGPNWVDYLGINSPIAIQNRAFGGLVTRKNDELSNTIVDKIRFSISSSMDQEIERYYEKSLGESPISDPEKTLFFIWVGGNDYLNMLNSDKLNMFLDNPESTLYGYVAYAERIVKNIMDSVDTLYSIGARNFMVVNMPNLGLLPSLKDNTMYHKGYNETSNEKLFKLSSRLAEVSKSHNLFLANKIAEYNEAKQNIKISLVDLNQTIDNILNKKSLDGNGEFNYHLVPGEYSTIISSKDESVIIGNACYAGIGLSNERNLICSEPSQMIFWDYAHPSTFSHCMLGAYINQFGGENSLLPYKYWQNYIPTCHLKPFGL